MKKILILILSILLILSYLTSCANFQDIFNKYQKFMQPYYEDMELAVEYAKSLILAVGNDDFETAKKYLHPEIINMENILEKKIYTLEEKYNLDFSNGVVIKSITDETIAINNIRSNYTARFKLIVGEEDFELYFVATRNNNGFGISNITQYKP